MKKQSNDYSFIEADFKLATGESILQTNSFSADKIGHLGVSVIIPSKDSNDSLELVLNMLNDICVRDSRLNLECIVIDDYSINPISSYFGKINTNINLKIIKNEKNEGAGISRQKGVIAAQHETIVFLDSDTVPTSDLFINHAIAHSFIKSYAIFVSFRESVDKTDSRLQVGDIDNTQVDITKDFRIRTFIDSSWPDDINYTDREVRLLEETNYWKSFGYGKRHLFWSLPMMGLTCALSCRKSLFQSVNFHPELFLGWGFEDTAMCASLIAGGAYLIPNLNSAVLHIKHQPRSGSKQKKLADFKRNEKRYQDFLDLPFLVQ